jgi:hypothetical protein
VWRDADITELLNLRTKSILAGDLNANHPVWNSKVSYLKPLDLFVNSNFDISVPQHPTHFVSDGRGDDLDIVAITMFGSQMSKYWTSWIQITYLACFASCIMLRLEKFSIQLKNSQTGRGFKALPLP